MEDKTIAENKIRRVFLQGFHLQFQLLFYPQIIRIEESYQFSFTLPQSRVSRFGQFPILLRDEPDSTVRRGKALYDIRRRVRRAVVNDDQFPSPMSLGNYRLN